MRDRMRGSSVSVGERLKLQLELMKELRSRTQLPDDMVTVVAPLGQSVHSLDRVTTPLMQLREELGFARGVAAALGIPPIMLLQGSGAVGSSAESTSASSGSWADSAESNNRLLLDTCRFLTMHLQQLLEEVYSLIYPESSLAPTFHIAPIPTFSIEQLLGVFTAQLIEDEAFSGLLNVTWGAPLGSAARAARSEQRAAEYVLPFRDRVGAPKAK
jgi:hypothetical protein